MKLLNNSILAFAIISTSMYSCQPNSQEEAAKKSNKAIELHDEIMPKMGHLDRSSIKIDSILTNIESLKLEKPSLDTTNLRSELNNLKDNIEEATDLMNEWMKNYNPDNTKEDYQDIELNKMKEMKEKFDEVESQIDQKIPKI